MNQENRLVLLLHWVRLTTGKKMQRKLFGIVTARQRRCWKVMFAQVSVIPSMGYAWSLEGIYWEGGVGYTRGYTRGDGGDLVFPPPPRDNY